MAETIAEIRSRFVHPHASCHVHEDILISHLDPHPLAQDRDEERNPVVVHADRGPARHAERAGSDKSLYFEEQGPGAFETGDDDGAGSAFRPLFQEDARGVAHLFESRVLHFKDADLVGGTVAVLHSPQDPESVGVVAFEIEDRVHEVLENLGSCNGSVLGHVSDQKGGDAGFLGPVEKPGGDLSHLAHAARRRGQSLGVHGLNGVHDKEIGLKLVYPFKEVLDAGPCEEEEVFRMNRKPLGPVS